MSHILVDEEDPPAPSPPQTVPIADPPPQSPTTFFTFPLLTPLLFDNNASDCRDHCANERTFLSYLRLSVYMAVIAVAIVLSFHLSNAPTEAELKMAKPLGFVFWVLSVTCLGVGVANYVRTVNRYSRKAAMAQSGWKTQSIMVVISVVIVGTCITLLVVNRLSTVPPAYMSWA